MTRNITAWLKGLLLMLIAVGASAQSPQTPELVDRIIAVVGQDVVLLSELRSEMRKLAQQGVAAGPDGSRDMAALQQRAFDRLILNKLQLAEAKRLGIDVDDSMVNRAVASIAATNGLDMVQLRAALEAEGIDFDTYRQSIREEIVIRRLRSREVTDRIEVTSSEVDSYLEKTGGAEGRKAIKLSYIRMEVAKEAADEQRDQIRMQAIDIAEQLRAGADFGSLARQVSDGENAANGGDMGWLEVDRLPPLFQPYANTMQVNEIQGPIEAGVGFHIIKLEGVRGGQSKIVRQTLARHILIRTNEVTSDGDARNRLTQLRQRILGGEDFATLARANSDDQASAINGGELGWSTPGNLVPRFEAEMNALEPDEVSEPFETDFGWHIVQVLDRRDYDATDETRRDSARKAVRDEKAKDALTNYLRRLRDEAYVELRIDDIYN